MARLSEQLRDWLARAEILARGAEHHRFDAARALEDGTPWVARSEALELLADVPGSPVALALWADAAEAMFLDHEVVLALERLASAIPFRADVWLRLGRARERLGRDPADAFDQAASAPEPTEAVDAARFAMAERDLDRGDPERAERWIERLSLGARIAPRARILRLEAALALGQSRRAADAAIELAEPDVLDARGWLTWARWRSSHGASDAVPAWTRALILGAPGALRAAADWVAGGAPDPAVDTLESIVTELGNSSDPSWTAALALRRGRVSDALAALSAKAKNSVASARELLTVALRLRDRPALDQSRDALRALGADVDPGVEALSRALAASTPAERLEQLDGVFGAAADWADELRHEIYAAWLGADPDWPALLGELGGLARDFGSLDALRDIETVAVDLERPLRVAIVGEFNAGKSSFINALLGEVVAPVGVLPTTATQNRLVWSPDRFVRIETVPGYHDRVVAHGELGRTLREMPTESVLRVTIYAPLELLRRLELYDTPGFNAMVPGHADAARATIDETHVALWLLDATQPLKDTERAVLTDIARRVPVVVLMNKSDRLEGAAAIEAALGYAKQGLASLGITPISPVIALSARQALAARAGASAGDPTASEAWVQSGWPEVERLVERVLFAQSDELRQRVLLERARRALERIVERARQREIERQQQSAARERASLALSAAEARVASEREALERHLAAVLDQVLARLEVDVRPALGLAEDAGASRFVVSRARDAMGRQGAQAILDWLALSQDAAAATAAELERRIGTVSAALAPQLVVSAGEVPAQVRSHWISLAIDELSGVLDQAFTEQIEPTADASELRAHALSKAFEARAVQ